MACWFVLRAYQTVLYRIILQKNPFFTQFLAKFLSKFFQIIISLYFSYFLQLKKKIKSNSLDPFWNALGLSQQTTVSLNYYQSIKINIGPSDGGTIISSSRRPTVLYQRLTGFMLLQVHFSNHSNLIALLFLLLLLLTRTWACNASTFRNLLVQTLH